MELSVITNQIFDTVIAFILHTVVFLKIAL